MSNLTKFSKLAAGAIKRVDEKPSKQIIAYYFSAHWCPPCRQFTPILKKFYEITQDKLDIVFVSRDFDKKSQIDYMSNDHGNWFCIDCEEDKDAAEKQMSEWGITGIPALIVTKANGDVVTKQGREAVVSLIKTKEDPSGKTVIDTDDKGQIQLNDPANLLAEWSK